ncbi:unnamed protein product, partial [Bubo scandiacus]
SCEGSRGCGLGGEARVSGILLSLEALVDPAPGQSAGETAQHWTDWGSGPRNWCLEPDLPGPTDFQ